jgi:hypothetical protein
MPRYYHAIKDIQSSPVTVQIRNIYIPLFQTSLTTIILTPPLTYMNQNIFILYSFEDIIFDSESFKQRTNIHLELTFFKLPISQT